MNAIAKPEEAGLFSASPAMEPAALARWATGLDQLAINGEASSPALAATASSVAEQTFDLLLDMPARTAEGCIAQLVVLVNRTQLAAECGGTADEIKEEVSARVETLEGVVLSLAKTLGIDPGPLGASVFFRLDAMRAAGFPNT